MAIYFCQILKNCTVLQFLCTEKNPGLINADSQAMMMTVRNYAELIFRWLGVGSRINQMVCNILLSRYIITCAQ